MKLFIIIFLLSLNYCFGQNNPATNDLDNIYTPPTGSVFDVKSSVISSHVKEISNVTQSKNIIVLNLVSILRANLYFTYERALNENFSVLGGVGFYYARDYIGLYGHLVSSSLSSSASKAVFDQYEKIWSSQNTDFNLMNIQFGFAGRLYFDKDFGKRNHFEIGARFYNWNFKAKTSNIYSLGEFYGTPEFNINNQLYYCNYGKQWSSGEKVKRIQEFYVGLGMRFFSFDELKGTTLGSYTITQLTGQRTSLTDINILLGYKLGLGW